MTTEYAIKLPPATATTGPVLLPLPRHITRDTALSYLAVAGEGSRLVHRTVTPWKED